MNKQTNTNAQTKALTELRKAKSVFEAQGDPADLWMAEKYIRAAIDALEGERSEDRIRVLAQNIAELSKDILTLQDYHRLDPLLVALWLEFHPPGEGERS